MIWRFVGVTHTKAVIGWSMPEHMRTYLIYDTITMAAGNVELQPGAVFHSDSEHPVHQHPIRRSPDKARHYRRGGPHRCLLG